MRAFAGPLLVHTGLLAAGLGILRALGVIDSLLSVRALAAGGLAYMTAVALVLGVAIVVLIAGGAFSLPLLAGLCAVCALPLARDVPWRRIAGMRIARLVRLSRPGDLEHLVAAATLAAFAVVAVIGLFTLGNRPIGPLDVDAWNQWTRKALLLFHDGHLPATIFGFSGGIRFEAHYNINPDYPLLLPLLEAAHLRALGRADPSAPHLVLWLLMVAWVWAAAFLAARFTRPAIWALVPAAAALLSRKLLLSDYADLPVAFFLSLGALALGGWLEGVPFAAGRRRGLALAGLLLGGAALTKNEGQVGALLAFAVAAVLLLGAGERRLVRDAAAAAAAVAALAILPWRLWVSAHHLQAEHNLSDAVNPAFLAAHAGRAGPAVRALVHQLGSRTGAAVFVSVALALIVVRLIERSGRRLALFYLGLGTAYFCSLVWSYWTGPDYINRHLGFTDYRIKIGVAMIAVAAVLALSRTDDAAQD